MYHLHPNETLQELFRLRPYQGADPATARFLFFGLDANFDPTIGDKPHFSEIVSYLEKGPCYWRERGFHHPFLHPLYRGDGAPYHRRFSQIGFLPEHADKVSFVELVEAPTSGRSSLRPHDLTQTHLDRLRQWVFDGQASHVFMPPNVAMLLRRMKQFSQLATMPTAREGSLPVLFRSTDTLVLSPFHFSYWGRNYTKRDRESQMSDIRRLTIGQPLSRGDDRPGAVS